MVKVENKAVLSTCALLVSIFTFVNNPQPPSVMARKPDYILALCYFLVYVELAWLIHFIWRNSRD